MVDADVKHLQILKQTKKPKPRLAFGMKKNRTTSAEVGNVKFNKKTNKQTRQNRPELEKYELCLKLGL